MFTIFCCINREGMNPIATALRYAPALMVATIIWTRIDVTAETFHASNFLKGTKHLMTMPRSTLLSSSASITTNTVQKIQDVNTNNNNVKKSGVGTSVPIRVAYQGEPGAYSEKATRELLGGNVVAVARPNFEACYKAVASTQECEYACIPIENSLGGSIHENYDLMLRYADLTIVAEHEFRVQHCLLVRDGVDKQDLKYAISHPQALAQCDNYLRSHGITPIPLYDTAGSAKMLASDPDRLPTGCTPQNTAAIASDLAGTTYGLKCLEQGIEDDDSNFTRFLLLGRKSVLQYLNTNIPSKTSIVFTLPNQAGALYKALACFSLRDIDFSKIESRPTSASLLNFLKFRSQLEGKNIQAKNSHSPRFRYCFYLDILTSESDEDAQNALHHLREQADFCRVLGSYPQKSRLVGPVAAASEELKNLDEGESRNLSRLPSDDENKTNRRKLNIGILGFGRYGQFLATKLSKRHHVTCTDIADKSRDASEIGIGDKSSTGIKYYPPLELDAFFKDLDVVLLAAPLIDFENVVSSLPKERLRGKLVVEVCPLSSHTKSIMLRVLPPDVDIICTIPMFGPATASASQQWAGLPFLYEKVRVADVSRANSFLSIFEDERCKMVEMTADLLDATIADAEFITHLTGRLLSESGSLLPPVMVSSKEYSSLLDVVDKTTGEDSTFDFFYGLYKFNPNSRNILDKLRDNLAKVEQQLLSKEAYLKAKAEIRDNERQRLMSEFKLLLQEATALPTEVEQNTQCSSPAVTIAKKTP